MKVYLFEKEAWVKDAWEATGTPLQPRWIDGLLTVEKAEAHPSVEIISIDLSILTSTVLAPLKRLKFIALRSTGTDQVDLEYCRSRNIRVSHVPAYAQNAVAEHVFALLLSLSRRICAAGRRTRELNFSWDGLQGFELMGKTLAVIGTGAIGRRVAAIASGFGMTVVAVDRFPDENWAAEAGVPYLALEDALQLADVVSLHVPGTPETKGMLSSERFGLLKQGVVIINTARADVMDSRALLEALASGKVAAAGLDVLPAETDLMSEDFRVPSSPQTLESRLTGHLLLQHPRVIATPHCAFFTQEAASRLIATTVANIESFMDGNPRNSVC